MASPPQKDGGKPRANVYSFALQNDVEAIAMAQHLAKRWKKVGVIQELPTEADGSLTASGKVRRRVVEQRHADEIAALYGGG